MTEEQIKKITFIIRLACIAFFLGRGWEYLFFDAPFRTLLWSQGLMQGVIESLTSMRWEEWVKGGGAGELFINGLTRALGVFFIMAAIVSCFIKSHQKKLGIVLLFGSLAMVMISFLLFMGKGFAVGMFIEHAIQMGIGVAFYLTLFYPQNFDKYLFYFKLLISFTFIGHGLFAIGYYPIPGGFIDMIINTFGFTEDNAVLMLRFAGILDFSAAIFIFVPGLELYALGFNIFWGLTTAFARSVAHIDINLLELTSHQWIFETIYRLPHGLLPLALFFYVRSRSLDPQDGYKSKSTQHQEA
ncbi:MAG: hypothetical protein CME62_07195 [Halobacteriovoraceae bacterium]|nr:hypothetical protein [Halobacteriovoraceae bacterium]